MIASQHLSPTRKSEETIVNRAPNLASGLVLFSALVSIAALTPSAVAQTRDTLLVVAGSARTVVASDRPVPGFKKIVKLDGGVIELGDELAKQIGNSLIYEDGAQSPPGLQAFADAVLAAAPDIFSYQSVEVVSDTLVPIELVRRDGKFLGDTVAISHEFLLAGRRYRRAPPRQVALSRYVIEAAYPAEGSRLEQDIVLFAAQLEKEAQLKRGKAFPVHLHLNPAPDSFRRGLVRDDIAVLHIDTHGSSKGREVQTTPVLDKNMRRVMMPAHEIPRRVRVPLVLLVGCEGVADNGSFGAVLRARGAEAVVSSHAKFNSFALTGSAVREKRIYEAFFDALRSSKDVANALLELRQAARDEMAKGEPEIAKRTLTRHFFVLLGNGRLRFKLASSER